MKTIDRRDFLKMAGAGAAAVAAGAAMPVAGFFGWSGQDQLRFRAVTGMPRAPWPTYASYVIEGRVDLHARTGQLAKSIHAGAPEAMSGIVFPGTARSVRVTDVRRTGTSVVIQGELVDKSQLLKGESPTLNLQIDQANGLAHADLFGSMVTLRLDE
jgi:TAT (twin-arginine translocation) pathway signal sequence